MPSTHVAQREVVADVHVSGDKHPTTSVHSVHESGLPKVPAVNQVPTVHDVHRESDTVVQVSAEVQLKTDVHESHMSGVVVEPGEIWNPELH